MIFFAQPGEFFPTADKIFLVKKDGRKTLSTEYPDAYKQYIEGLRTMRSWFSSPQSQADQLQFLTADFKKNTDVKERCREYVKTKMKELKPLLFECPTTGSTHRIAWPYEFVYECVLSRRHEWKKLNPLTKFAVGAGNFSTRPLHVDRTYVR